MSHYRPKIECWNELLRSHTQELENTVKATDIIVDIVREETAAPQINREFGQATNYIVLLASFPASWRR